MNSKQTSSIPPSPFSIPLKNLPAQCRGHGFNPWVSKIPLEEEMTTDSSILEKGVATHFSILPWKIPWTEEPGGLWSKV